MKPAPAVYDSLPRLPANWRRNRKKGLPEVYAAYCRGCGAVLPLERNAGLQGVDENDRAYYEQCLFCGVTA